MQVMAIASSALQLVGTIAGGEQAGATGVQNAQTLRRQARAQEYATYDRENLVRQRSASALSDQRASLLANGVDPSSGTAAIGVAQGAVDAEMDALTQRYEGLMQARNTRIEANNVEWEGRAKRRQSYISAAGQLMSSASGYLGQKQAPAPVESRTPTVYR